MEQRKLGSTGPNVSALGLGCMGMSEVYGPADRGESVATVHAALDAGITLLDTGDFYAMGHNEMLVREALKDVARDKVQISVKFGALRGPAGDFIGMDTRPAATKNFLAYSLQRLGTDYIDVYRPARLDPSIPIEETIGGIADLQIEYSLIERGIERDILKTCRELGIAITAYGVLARGLISGHWSKDSGKVGRDFRLMTPRFQGANLDANLALVEQLRTIAAEIGATPAQVAIAWVAAQGKEIVPLIGARTRTRLTEALGATRVTLTPAHLAALAKAFPPNVAAGTRYAAEQMAHLDSEKPATK